MEFVRKIEITAYNNNKRHRFTGKNDIVEISGRKFYRLEPARLIFLPFHRNYSPKGRGEISMQILP